MAAQVRTEARYAAFISYSHADEKAAAWLHERLEAYRIPRELAGSPPRRRLGRIFRDRAELPTSHDLGAEIRKALDRSDALIVLCSPEAAESPYVDEEVRYFKASGKGERIFAVILRGEPHAERAWRSTAEECFPRALTHRVDARGRLTREPEEMEPIAADIRPGKDGRDHAALKIIAGLLGVGLDDLIRRERLAERARRLRASSVAAAMAVLLLGALVGGALTAWRTAQAAHKASDILASEAQRLADEGFHETALLMALQADPAAQRSSIRRVFDGKAGYPSARAQLEAAGANMRLELMLPGHAGAVSTVSFSPDGRRVVTGDGGDILDEDGAARVWDAATGALLLTIPHGSRVTSAAFSPDGRRLLTGDMDGRARIWDAATGALLLTLTGGGNVHGNQYTPDNNGVAGAFSADGRRIVTTWKAVISVWDAATGQALLTLGGNDTYPDFAVSFSPDGRRLVTGGQDGAVRVWDARSGTMLRRIAHGSTVLAVGFSPDGRRLVTGAVDGVARVVDAEKDELLLDIQGLGGAVTAAAFSPDGDRLVTGMMEGAAVVWDAGTGEQQVALEHRDRVYAAAFSPDGRRLVTGSHDGVARVWDVAPRGALLPIDGAAHDSFPIFSLDGDRLVTQSKGGAARVWNTATGKLLLTLEERGRTGHTAAISPDRHLIATSSGEGIALWDATSGAELLTIDSPGSWEEVAGFSPDGQCFLTWSGDGTARVRDTATGAVLVTLDGHDGPLEAAAFSPDGRRVVAVSLGGVVRMWDAANGELLRALDAHAGRGIAFSPDGRRLVAGAQIWDSETGEVLALQLPAAPLSSSGHYFNAAAFSSDGRLVATGGDTTAIWDAATGVLIAASGDGVGALAFSADGITLLTASQGLGVDFSAHRWDLPAILLAVPQEQVRLACESLRSAHAPLAFTAEDASRHPVLQGEPTEPDGSFVSPCKGVLPADAFVR